MEGLVNVAPPIITAIVTALIAWLVVRRKEQSEIRLIDTQTLNEWREFERDTSEQLLKLNNALIEYQLRMRDMEAKMERMKTEYERRIEMYKSQVANQTTKIKNLEKRIRELENGKGHG